MDMRWTTIKDIAKRTWLLAGIVVLAIVVIVAEDNFDAALLVYLCIPLSLEAIRLHIKLMGADELIDLLKSQYIEVVENNKELTVMLMDVSNELREIRNQMEEEKINAHDSAPTDG